MKKDQKGYTVVAVATIILVLALMGTVSWLMYHHSHPAAKPVTVPDPFNPDEGLNQ